MKRWFTALVCLVLVASMVLPIPAMAAVSTIDLANHFQSKTTSNGMDVYNYYYSSGHASVIQYYDGSAGIHRQVDYSQTVTFDYSLRKKYNLTAWIGYGQNSYVSLGTRTDAFYFAGVNDVSNFKQATVRMSVTLKSSVAAKVSVYSQHRFFTSSGGTSSSYDGSTQTVSLAAGVAKTVTVSFSFTTNSKGYESVMPFVVLSIAAADCPTSGTLTVDSYGFEYTVKAGEALPQLPTFTKNTGGTYTYLKDEDSAPLSVSASVSDGGTLTYKWYKTDIPSPSGGSEVNSGKDCYPVTYFAGTSYYYCIVTNTLPNGRTTTNTSNLATVHVIGPPKEPQITQNLGSAIIEYKQGDSSLALTVQAITIDGGTLSYQWYENNAPSTEGGTLISGATLCHYFPSTSEIGIKYYYCVVTNTISGYFAEATSSVAGIRVVSPPDPALSPKITTNLSTDEVVYITGTAAAALRIGASAPDGGELSYQWYSAASATAAGVEIPGATTASYTPETVVAGTTWYYCVVTNKLNDTSASVTSRIAMITVQDPPPETVPPQLDEMNDKLDETNNFLDNIVQGILNLPQAILDGIKGLFVPDAEAMAAYQDQWSELLRTRFGAIYESVDVIGSFFETISLGDKQEEVVLPSVTVDLAGTPWTFGGWSVRVVPEGLEFLCTYSKLIVNIICTFAFINGLRNKFEGILGGA